MIQDSLLPVGTRIVLKVKKDTYKYYTGKQGTIVSVAATEGHVEYGVNFSLPIDASHQQVIKASSHAWFTPSEVIIL